MYNIGINDTNKKCIEIRKKGEEGSVQCIKSEIEVQQFLDKVHEILEGNGKWSINNQPWSPPKTNKTRVYMAESGVTGWALHK